MEFIESMPGQLLLILLLQGVFGVWGAASASRTNLHPVAGFFIGFIAGLTGIIILYVLANAMPKSGAPESYHGRPSFGTAPLNYPDMAEPAERWSCACGNINPREAARCLKCGTARGM